MASLNPSKDFAETRSGLVELLREVSAALARLNRQAVARTQEDSAGAGFCPRQLGLLCATIERGRDDIGRCIVELGARTVPKANDPGSDRTTEECAADPLPLIKAYRTCCHRLCAAAREAGRLLDWRTGAMLCALILRLEKQLWLIDAPPQNRGVAGSRSVELFFE